MPEVDILGLPNDPLPVVGDVLEGQKAIGGSGSSKHWLQEDIRGHHVYKPADKSLAEVTVLEDDNHLKFPMLANAIYQFKFWAFVKITSAAPDIKIALNGPADLQHIRYWAGGVNRAGDPFTYGEVIEAYETTLEPNYGNSPDIPGAFILQEGTVENGANAGDLVCRWAQRLSNVIPTVVQRGSFVQAIRIG